MDTKLSACMHTWRTMIDYRITPPTDLADGGVIAQITYLLLEIRTALANKCHHAGEAEPQVRLFRLLSHLLSGLKWTILGKQAGAHINQVKQVRSESRLTKCPLLIKFNGHLWKKGRHACASMSRQKGVVECDDENTGGMCVFTLADVTEEQTINLGESLCSLSALPVKPATNYCQRSKVLHLLLSFLI